MLLDELGGRVKSRRAPMRRAPVKPAKKGEPKRREGKLTLDMVEREVAEGDDDRVRSLAAYRRAQQKEKERRAKMMGGGEREQSQARSHHPGIDHGSRNCRTAWPCAWPTSSSS